MNKIKALWELFSVGKAVANPGAWTAGQITATILGGVLMALVHVYKAFTGHDLPIDTSTADTIGAGAIAVVNVVLSLVTSKHVGVNGLQPSGEPASDPVRSPATIPEGDPQPVPVAPRSTATVLSAAPVSRVDDATRQRALDYVRRAGNPSDRDFQAP